jgi:hypothetical protein
MAPVLDGIVNKNAPEVLRGFLGSNSPVTTVFLLLALLSQILNNILRARYKHDWLLSSIN